MGFCRRCGDIVVGTRCKCGGTAVAPVLQWSTSNYQTADKWSQTYVSRDKSPTRPSTHIDSASASVSHPDAASTGTSVELDQCTPHPSTSLRPSSSSPFVSTRITPQSSSATRPMSQSKRSFEINERSPPSSPATRVTETGILNTQNAPELSKAFGSILQPKESLAPYSCAICLTDFQPDATIFPHPSAELSDRFLCRPCFIISGGSKGDCSVCRRPVLILKSEGGFVETSGRVWHKKCFKCEGCRKSIGDTPMVDLLGQPSCADCFDGCLKRNITPRSSHSLPDPEKMENRLSASLRQEVKSREGSPAIDELEQRLGIMKSREGSPVLEELTQRLNAVLNRAPRNSSPSSPSSTSHLNKHREGNPLTTRFLERESATSTSSRGVDPADVLTDADSLGITRTITGLQEAPADSAYRDHAPLPTRPSTDAIEEMKNRFTNQATSSPMSSTDPASFLSNSMSLAASTPSRIPRISRIGGSSGIRHAMSSSSLPSSRTSWMPSTPDLVADTSDTLTQSSGPSSPTFTPQAPSRDEFGNYVREHTPTKDVGYERPASGMTTPKSRDSLSKYSIPTATLSSRSLCAKCGGSLFATGGSGRFVTVPEASTSGPPKTYHTECFRCVLCDGPFRETANGQAIFVRGEGGACHVECAPTEKVPTKSMVAPSQAKPIFADPNLSPPLVPLTNTIQSTPKINEGTNDPQLLQGSPHRSNTLYSSSRYERPSPSASSLPLSSSRFGSSAACPGCQRAVSPMEMGVVPGPQGSRWHATCLVCGGKGTGKSRRDKSQPGCGKRLDSAAKRDAEGGVWCRECLLLLPLHMRNPKVESPLKPLKPLTPSYTGRSTSSGPSIAPQFTGTTTIARQFTGRGGGESGVLRQLTGGGLSSARQLSGSPTKQLGLITPRPRPKSVIGIRSSKSFDEGRGMYLVRQMTGGGGSFAM